MIETQKKWYNFLLFKDDERDKIFMPYRRTPQGYNGSKVTSHKLSEILSPILKNLKTIYKAKPSQIIESWHEIIGPQFANETKAKSFEDGILMVHIKNSTVMSLLSNPLDKKKILDALRSRFPGTNIKNIMFRIGSIS